MRRNGVAAICTALCFLCCSCGQVSVGGADTTLILGALKAESAPFEKVLADKKAGTIEGIGYYEGRLKGRKAVIAWTGIGKVNAAMTGTLLMEHFRPREVIVCGMAGEMNPELQVGDVVIAETSCQHDLGFWTKTGIERKGYQDRLTNEFNPVFLAADERLFVAARRAGQEVTLRGTKSEGQARPAKVLTGVVVTGDTFIMSPQKRAELRSMLGADAVEMEGAAIAQICHQRNIPHIIIRAISDTADEKAMQQLNVFQKVACENAAAVVLEMMEVMQSQRLQQGRHGQ